MAQCKPAVGPMNLTVWDIWDIVYALLLDSLTEELYLTSIELWELTPPNLS